MPLGKRVTLPETSRVCLCCRRGRSLHGRVPALVCIDEPCPCALRRVKGVPCPRQHSASCSVRCAVSRTDATCQAIRARSTSGLGEATSRKAMRPTAQAAAAGERSADAPALCRKLLTAVTHQNVTRHNQRRASSRLVCLLLQSISNISLGEFLH